MTEVARSSMSAAILFPFSFFSFPLSHDCFFPFNTKANQQKKLFGYFGSLALATVGSRSPCQGAEGYRERPGTGRDERPHDPQPVARAQTPERALAEPRNPACGWRAPARGPGAPPGRRGRRRPADGDRGPRGGQVQANARGAGAGAGVGARAWAGSPPPIASPRGPLRPARRPAPRSPPTRARLRLFSVCASCWPR